MSSQQIQHSQDGVLVLGMHRSGTSALAGVLSLLGCATPASLIRGDANNEKGYFESDKVGRLSDSILEYFDTAWNDWQPIDLTILSADQRAGFEGQIQSALSSDFGTAPLFVLKEPRMCRMVPLWQSAIENAGVRVKFVHTHRNPQEVAASLNRRDGYTPAYGYLMWMRHVLDAEQATRGQPRVFTSYAQLMQDWRGVAGKLDKQLALPFPTGRDSAAQDIDAFLSQDLQHNSDAAEQTLADTGLPLILRETFAVMERWAGDAENPEDHAKLDALRAELDGLATAFAPLARPGQLALLENQLLTAETADPSKRDTSQKAAPTAVQTAALSNLRAQITTKEAQIQDLFGDIRDASIEEMSGTLKHLGDTVETKDLELARFLDVVRERGDAIKERDSDIAWFRTQLEGRETEAQAMQGDAIEREELIQMLQDENTMLAQSAAEAEERNRVLKQSASWRFTAPLRSLLLFLRGRLS